MTEKKIIAQCKNNDHSYITASGRWLPCCSFPDHGPIFYNSIFNKSLFLIENSVSFNKYHELDIFKLWIEHIEENYDSASNVCKSKCGHVANKLRLEDDSILWSAQQETLITNNEQLDSFLKNNE